MHSVSLFLQCHSRCRSMWIIRQTGDRWIPRFTWNLSDCSVALPDSATATQRFHQCALRLPLPGMNVNSSAKCYIFPCMYCIKIQTCSVLWQTEQISVWRVDCSELHQQPVDAVLRPSFAQKLCYKLSSIVTFTFIQIFDRNFVSFTEQSQSCRVCSIQRQNSRYFGVWFERRKVDKKSKPTWKLKHGNFVLEPFEYFCQISSNWSL